MAWTTVATLAGLGDSTAATLINTATSQTRAAISAIFGPSVAEQMAQDQTIEDAAVLAMEDAAVQAQLAWSKTTLTASTDLNTMTTPGQYAATAVPTDSVTQNYPTTDRGMLIVGKQGTSAFYQMWITYSTAAPRMFMRVTGNGSTGWGAWKELSNQIIKPFISGSADLNTITTDGDYPANASVTDWDAQNYPANVRGHLSVRVANAWVFQTFRSNELASPRVWIRLYNTAWSDWQELTGGGSSGGSGGAMALRHQLLIDDLMAIKGGPIGTGGATPVALTFDDYPRDFRDYMRASLNARGIPYTLALSSRMYDSAALTAGGTWEAVYNGATGTTWAEIAGWLDADGAEVANHSATHNGGAGNSYLWAEIAIGRADLEVALNRAIWTWVQPSATYIDDSGAAFNNGDSLDSYAGNYAGQTIVNQHVMGTGVRLVNGLYHIPRRGQPFNGITRTWLSSAGNIADTKTRIQSATTAGHGIIIGSHANDIPDARITQADFDGFLDWLIVEQTAGRIKLMLLSEWAIADTRFPAV